MTPGTLVLVATPIGNLGDLPPRAVAALQAADVICCEDTRHSRKLLDHAGITPKRLLAVHAHNEAEAAERLVAEMRLGVTVACITDAGTPGISDPGERLVAAAVAAGVRVELVPGPAAVIAALVLSGLPTGRFCFEGFLPRKGRERAETLRAIAAEPRTTVLYEAPHRLVATVGDLHDACGGTRRIAIARELTKKFEEVWRGTLAERRPAGRDHGGAGGARPRRRGRAGSPRGHGRRPRCGHPPPSRCRPLHPRRGRRGRRRARGSEARRLRRRAPPQWVGAGAVSSVRQVRQIERSR